MSSVAWRRFGAILCFSLTLPFAPLFGQVSVKLLPSSGTDFDYFGEAVAIDGDYAIVGSWLDDNANGKDAGTARIFHRVGAAWQEQAILLPSDGEAGDQFGISVTINGDFAFVGAHRDDNSNGPFAGAVYVYERTGENWTEREKLIAADGAFDDQFGGALASTGQRLIIGAPGVNQRRGAAYVYHQAGGDWLFVNRVTIASAMQGDAFGESVGVNGDYAVVGAKTNDGSEITDAGAAYALVFNGTAWVEQQKLVSPSPVLEGAFGHSVDISSTYIIIGAPQENIENEEEAGAAYIFVRNGGAWSQQAKLSALNEEAGDAFGYAVAIEGDYAVVGARWDRNNQEDKSGAAYIYSRAGVAWNSEARLLAGDGDVGDQLGNAVDISNEQVLVGARWDDNQVGKDAGSAYIFPIGGSGVPSLLTSVSDIDFSTVAVGENTDREFTITNIGTADLSVSRLSLEGEDAQNFRFIQGGNAVVLAPLASVNAILEFAPVSPGEKDASLRIESNSPSSPQLVSLRGAGADGVQPGIAKVIAFRGDVESYFGSTVSVEGDYAIVGAEGQRDTEPGAAYIYKRNGNTWVQEIRISPLDGQAGDRFGSAVDISSTHAIVGAWNDDEARGSAYVFVKSGSAWIQQAKLVANDRAIEDRFGQSVSIEGDHAIVGSWQDDNIRGDGAGSAYVYELDGSTWQQQFKLVASDGEQGDRFGSAVTVQGNDVIVGAANGGFFGEGTAYVFSSNGAVWEEEGKLSSSDAGLSDGFGTTVAIEGNVAVVGAPIHDRQSSIDEGAAYVFEKVNGTWIQRTKLSASDGASGYEFGGAVDLVGGEIVVGAGGANNQTGAIYMFSRSGDNWFETNVLAAGNGADGDGFGSALAFTGLDIIIGAPEDNNVNGVRAGSVYLFEREGAGWREQAQLLASSRLVEPAFGAAVAIDGEYAVIGAQGDAESPGAAYVFKRSGENWTQQTELSASDGVPGDGFGSSVDISGNNIVVGASGDDNERGDGAGAAYVFLKGSETWSEQARLIADDGQNADAFGAAVAIDGDYIGVGAPDDDNASGVDAGGAYIFQRNGAGWTQLSKVLASDGVTGDAFGSSLSLQFNTFVASAPREGLLHSGALYVFDRNGSTWNQEAKLISSEAEAEEALGNAVALDENYIIAGAENRDGGQGAVYVFHRIAGQWGSTEERMISLGDGQGGDRFGSAVAISSQFALVGGSGIDDGRGATYLFERNGNDWLQQTRLNPVDEGGQDAFGLAVALQGDNAVIGARNDDNGNGQEAGAAYLISLTGSVSIVSIEADGFIEKEISLEQNYPNPFAGRTTIPFELSEAQQIKLEIYDLLGRRVATLVDGFQPAGRYEVTWTSKSLAGGVYFGRLTAGSSSVTEVIQIVNIEMGN